MKNYETSTNFKDLFFFVVCFVLCGGGWFIGEFVFFDDIICQCLTFFVNSHCKIREISHDKGFEYITQSFDVYDRLKCRFFWFGWLVSFLCGSAW